MSAIDDTFNNLQKRDEAAFIPFVVLGDPDRERSGKVLSVLSNHADLMELGFPFSDPIADGPRIQAADQRALSSDISQQDCFDLLAKLHEEAPSIPICLLIYYNLIYSRGTDRFLNDAKQAGVDGLLVADMPVEESDSFHRQCREHKLDQIFIVSPTTSEDRMDRILSQIDGFVYTVAVVGVTGEREQVQKRTLELIQTLKSRTDVPVCVGFGISSPEHVREMVEAGADGVIVGSAIEAIIEEHQGDEDRMVKEIDEFTRSLKEATIK